MAANMSFGDYIKERRLNMNIKLREFADMIGVVPSYVSDIEKGNRNPTESYLEKIIKALKLSDGEKDTFYDLVGKARNEVSPDLNEYIQKTDIARVALRRARDKKIPNGMWEDFINKIDKERK